MRRYLAGVAWLAGACSAATAVPAVSQDCAAVALRSKPSVAVAVCQREYAETGDPATGALLAEALWRGDKLDEAKPLATRLLASTARASALRVLGRIALDERRIDDAEAALTAARDEHLSQHRPVEAARDIIPFTGVLYLRDRYPDALRACAECVAYASFLDGEVAGKCHLTAAELALHIGNLDLADRELRHAEPLLETAWDRAQYELSRGNLLQELAREPLHKPQHEQAEQAFLAQHRYASEAELTSHIVSADLNLSYTLAELGRTEDAQRRLDAAVQTRPKLKHGVRYQQLQANIEYRRHNLDAAWSLNETIYPKLTGHDPRIEVASLQARIALARRDFAATELWALRGIEAVEKLRASAPLDQRAWTLATRREPYELLFVAYARSGRPRDALLSIDRWQGRTTRDAIATARRGGGLVRAADDAEAIRRWLGSIPSDPATPAILRWAAPQPDLAAIDLLAVLLADHQIWSVTSQHGEVAVRNLGDVEPFEQLATRVRGYPDDRTFTTELGGLVLRDGIARVTSEVLYVLIDGPFATLPVAALRAENRPVIAARPILRVSELPAHPCEAPRRPAQSVVLADADAVQHLPEARREASAVAAHLGVTAKLGPEATSTALFAAPADALLHVATHGDVDGGEVLRLHDREVTALEISARAHAPARVVMSVCHSAAALDPEAAGSLAAAFLAAGSRQVVAAVRTVTDAGAAEVIGRFYRAGGATDPVRALARAQAELAETANPDWSRFAVFGHDVCPAP
jgi:hypothetical protein